MSNVVLNYSSQVVELLKRSQVPTGSKYNICNQAGSVHYFNPDDADSVNKVFKLYRLLELSRLNCESPLHLSERQLDKLAGIDLDFDLYINSNTVENTLSIIQTNKLFTESLIEEVFSIILDTLKDTDKIKTYCAVLVKPPRLTDKNNMQVVKESFRLRFPGIMISSVHKAYIISTIMKTPSILKIFTSRVKNIHGEVSKILDENSSRVDMCLLGSCKNGATIAHQIAYLYECTFDKSGFRDLQSIAFNDEELFGKYVKTEKKSGKSSTVVINQPTVGRYNLVQELSLIFKFPGGLIEKREYHPDDSIISQLRDVNVNLNDDENILNMELNALREYHPDAQYICYLLDALPSKYYDEYNEWCQIIYILASYMPVHIMKPISKWFSKKSSKFNEADHDKRWNSAVNYVISKKNSVEELNKILNSRSVEHRTTSWLFARVKAENEPGFREIYGKTLSAQVFKLVDAGGEPTDAWYAEIIKKSDLGLLIFTDIEGDDYVWVEYVNEHNSEISQYAEYQRFKWSITKNPPVKLIRFITTKLQNDLIKIAESQKQEWSEKLTAGGNINAAAISYKMSVLDGLIKKKFIKLGNVVRLNSVINMYKIISLQKGVRESMDSCHPQYLGVGNGILFPGSPEIKSIATKSGVERIIQERSTTPKLFNQNIGINITRYTRVIYNTLLSIEEQTVIEVRERLFDLAPENEHDAIHKILVLFSTSLTGQPKTELLILLSGGANGGGGKSTLLTLMANTLGFTDKGGYCAPMPMSFYTNSNRHKSGGPDTEKHSLKYARFAYASESNNGDALIMDIIKSILTDIVKSNEKFKTAESFRVNAIHTIATNYDPGIIGNDYGTWRRILTYKFKFSFKDDPNPNNPFEKLANRAIAKQWVESEEIKQAFLWLLTYYYSKYYCGEYNGNLENCKSPTMEKEKILYQSSQNKYFQFKHELTYEDKKTPGTYTINDFALLYIDWYKRKYPRVALATFDVISLSLCEIFGIDTTGKSSADISAIIVAQIHINTKTAANYSDKFSDAPDPVYGDINANK